MSNPHSNESIVMSTIEEGVQIEEVDQEELQDKNGQDVKDLINNKNRMKTEISGARAKIKNLQGEIKEINKKLFLELQTSLEI